MFHWPGLEKISSTSRNFLLANKWILITQVLYNRTFYLLAAFPVSVRLDSVKIMGAQFIILILMKSMYLELSRAFAVHPAFLSCYF